MYRRIVVGTDGSATATEAVRAAVDLGRLSGAELHVVTAYSTPTMMTATTEAGGGHVAEWLSGAESAMVEVANEAAALATEAGVPCRTHVQGGPAAQVICHVAESVDADLVVVGDRGMHGARRLLTGSVPNHIAHHAGCSVLIVDSTRRAKG